MNWLFPGFLAGTFAVGLPIILHFLRKKPNTIVRFPTLRFLAQTAIRDTRKHRLRRLLTLLLRCLVIALLAAAFARPFFSDLRGRNARAVVVAVDNSMSMQTRGRWEALQSWALNQLDGLQRGDQGGVLLMHPTPTWLVPVSENLQQARAALRELQPGFEATRYLPALRMAGQSLAALPAKRKTLVWMADEQRIGWTGTRLDEPLPAGVRIKFAEPFPAPKSQAAITSLHWLRESERPAVEVTVRLFSPEKQTRKLSVKTRGKIIAVQTLELAAGVENTLRIPLNVSPDALKGGLSVSLDADDLAADDTAWLAPVPEASRMVLFSSNSGPASHFLEHALGSLGKLNGNDLAGKLFPNADWPADSVAVVTGDCFLPPLLDQLNRFVSAGGALWIVADGSPAQTRWLAERGVRVTERPVLDEPAHLRDWDLEHPILAAFAGQSLLPLMEVEFGRSFALEGESLTSVANWADGSTGLAEWNTQGRRSFISGFPLDRAATNWMVQPSFVPFVHQTARWLAALGEVRLAWHVGDTIPLPSAQGTWRAIESLRAEPERKVAGAVRATTPGLFEFFDGKTKRRFAVNAALNESDLTPWPEPEKLAALESKADVEKQLVARSTALRLSNHTAESQQRLWWWLLVACVFGLVAELALANRTAL